MAPKIYHLHPLVAGPLEEWPRHLARIRAMGFDHVGTAPLFAPGSGGDIFLAGDHEALNPALRPNGQAADPAIARLAGLCDQHGLALMFDVVLDRIAADAVLRTEQAGWFEAEQELPDPPDPRRPLRRHDTACARFADPGVADALGGWWVARLLRLADAGVRGFRCLHPHQVPSSVWRRVIGTVREKHPDTLFVAWTPGVPRDSLPRLAGVGFDRTASSLPWWDGRASWLVEEAAILHQIAPALGAPEPSFGERLAPRLDPRADLGTAYRRALKLAAALGAGIIVPMGFEYATRRSFDTARGNGADFERARQEAILDLSEPMREANALADRIAACWPDGELRALTGPEAMATALLRADASDVRDARQALVVLVNADLTRDAALEIPLSPLPPTAGAAFGRPSALNGVADLGAPLLPGEVRAFVVERLDQIAGRRARPDVAAALASPRIAIEAVEPAVDAGVFAVKRLAGEPVRVGADILLDGHYMLAAELLWRAIDEAGWHRVPMRLIENDRFEASFTPERVGRHIFAVEAWWDEWGTFRHDLRAKQEARQDVTLEIEEGRQFLRGIGIADSGDILSSEIEEAVRATEHRPFLARSAEYKLDADRPQAAFASWYEMFPRSVGGLDGVHKELARICAMGFNVLYFPPVHPIGHTNRKGRNNAIAAGPGDVGSPYAIGAEEGGHEALDPSLGTFDDFRRLLDATRRYGLEIALDFAVQCSLDHPWIKSHPEWFRWRPDGSIRYAENPPKKYQDIVNVEFYAEGAERAVWTALRDVVLFWLEHGVRIFRVDNPHTKPLPFWRWLIEDIQARDAGVIFLAEAFTRPKMMYRLAKVGFTQSYTYFTWRLTKAEIAAYLTELDAQPVRDFFRPNFFVNTPDINPYFLQTSGRAGFLIRAALAATLSGLWGMYSGFELCEAAPLPGREEYLDSEKYELRMRDWNAPGNIQAEIAALNRIRQANPALHSHLGVRFYNAFNDQILLYGKRAGRAMILTAVSVDPHYAQEAAIEVPVWEWGLPDSGSVMVDDLMRETRFVWHGKNQWVRLDPADLPFAIWRVMAA